jgi:hypothetical protein
LKKATLEEEKNTLEDYKLLQKDSIVGAIANAYKKNAKAAENVNSVQNVVNKDRKGDVERYLAAHPELQESDLTLISNGVEKTLLNIYTAGRLAIKKAEATGDEKTIKEAHEIYDDYVNIYKTDSEGRITEINTDAAKKVMARETGGGLELNLDEKKVFSVKVDDSEKNIKKAFSALGFDVEGAGKDKAKAAGLAFATAFLGTGLAALFGHSHKTASASATAQGETVQKDISWLASNGEAFTSLVEAQGGEAAVSVVAEACAKIPWLATLGAPALAGLAAYLLAKGKTDDVLNGANLKEALNNIKGADDKARPVLRDIKEMEITGDPTKDMAIKLAVLAAKQGESTKTLNERELVDAREALLQLKEAIPKIEDEAAQQPEQPEQPEQPVQPEEPVQPEQPEQPETPVAPENLKGWARDHALFDKYKATERDKNGVDKGRVQMVEGTVVGVTGDYEAPDTIKMQDDTNKDRIKDKIDTFNYRKLTDEEIAAGKTKDGRTIQIPDEIKNAGKPLYILETAVNEKNQDIKAKHEEVYQLNLEKSEDGKTYNYKLEQYEGMSGSGVTSAVPAKTTTVKKAVTKPTTGTGKADKTKTKEADPSTGKTEKEAAPKQYQFKLKSGAVVVPSPDEKGVYIDKATGDRWKRRPDGNFVKISSGTAKGTGKAKA